MVIFTLLTSFSLALRMTRPVRPVPLLEGIPAVQGVPAKCAGIAQKLLYDQSSYPA
jgi:hypothetical protein